MARVVLSFSMSLDGYVAGPDVSVRHAMGVGGERLHEWMFPRQGGAPEPADAAEVETTFGLVGATIVGRRTYDVGLQHWGDTPFPVPSFVLTHHPRAEQPMKSASFRFVTEGVEAAVREARAAAGDKDVIVMGASTAQQILRAGLADALHIQIVSVLLAGGVRLFDRIGDAQIELVRTRVSAGSPDVTHLDFNVSN
ncbi:dihydrofolate reductase family protein [Devosia sp. ZB163]|uniref:dihydrofolate reductase family protein n=1 Tax=Devosia sp. ZB163 TaxID=3025938 RepID=UPI00236262C9|nr:dihydrofolate reductase family protein [Devosia sp. ZB163]MDC9824342.1 dihydrofolate reductase family protein [Devosia sp. ZB163]